MVELFYRVDGYLGALQKATVWVCKSSEKIKKNTIDYLAVCFRRKVMNSQWTIIILSLVFLSQHYSLPGTENQPIIEPWDFVFIAGRLWGRTIEKVALKSDSLDSFLEKAKDSK